MKFKPLFFFALTFGLLTQLALGQSAVLLPFAPGQYFDASGAPLAGGSLAFYASGTFNQQQVFTDATGQTALPNPVTLSSGGFPENASGGTTGIWLTPGLAYRVVAKNSSSVQQWLLDGVTGLASSQAVTSTAITFSATPSFTAVAQNQLFTLTLTGNVTSSTFNVSSGLSTPVLVTFEITQDATGGRTFAWPPNAVGSPPVNSVANSVTVQTFVWDGADLQAVGPNHPLLNSQGSAVAITGSGSYQSAFSYILPANTLTPGKLLRVHACINHSNGTGSVSYHFSLGGQPFPSPAISSSAVSIGCSTTVIYAVNTSSVLANAVSGNAALSGWAADQTVSFDATSPETISFQFSAQNTETVTPIFFSVESIQ